MELLNKYRNHIVTAGVVVLSSVAARAADGDLAASTASLSTAVTTAGTVVAGLVALGAGLAVYKKVKGYFSRS